MFTLVCPYFEAVYCFICGRRSTQARDDHREWEKGSAKNAHILLVTIYFLVYLVCMIHFNNCYFKTNKYSTNVYIKIRKKPKYKETLFELFIFDFKVIP